MHSRHPMQKMHSLLSAGAETPPRAAPLPGLLPVKWALAALLASASLGAQALTLGTIQVQSTLGQPLTARVAVPQLTATESSSLTLTLGTAADYAAAGLSYDAALAGARVTLVPAGAGTQPHIQITGRRPVREPLVHLIVSAQWASGRVTRNYALLIDPPGGVAAGRPATHAAPAAPVPTPVPAGMSAPATPPQRALAPSVGAAAPLTTSTQPASRAQQSVPQRSYEPQARVRQVAAPRHVLRARAQSPAGTAVTPMAQRGGASKAASQAAARAPDKEFIVQRGDTAGQLVRRHAAAGATPEQLLAAFLRANPAAFTGGDINRLRAGAQVRMPSAEEANRWSPAQARALVGTPGRQSAGNSSSSSAAAAAPAKTAAAGVPASSNARSRQADAAPAVENQADRMAAASSTPASAHASTQAAEREIAALAARIAELEQRLNALQPQQPDAAAIQPQPAGAAALASADVLATDSTVPPPAGSAAAAHGSQAAAIDIPPAQPRPRGPVAQASALTVRTSAATAEPAPAAARPWHTAWRDLPGNAWLAPLLALLAGGYLLSARRRRRRGSTESDGVFLTDAPSDAVARPAAPVSAPASSSASANASAQGPAAVPVRRDAAPSSALPAKQAPRPALPPASIPAEIGAQVDAAITAAGRGDASSFARAARALRPLTDGSGSTWTTVAALGRLLDPEEALYRAPPTAPAADGASIRDLPAAPGSNDFSFPDPAPEKRQRAPSSATTRAAEDAPAVALEGLTADHAARLHDRVDQPAWAPPAAASALPVPDVSFPDLTLEPVEPTVPIAPLSALLPRAPATPRAQPSHAGAPDPGAAAISGPESLTGSRSAGHPALAARS